MNKIKNFKIIPAQEKDTKKILGILKFANMHHIPSKEMPYLDYKEYFLAILDDVVVGIAGFKLLSKTIGKTQLMVVHPDFRGKGIGKALHQKRIDEMKKLGVKKIITNADRPEAIEWYKKHFGCIECGKREKLCEFGDSSINEWTTLELDLDNSYVGLDDWKKIHKTGK